MLKWVGLLVSGVLLLVVVLQNRAAAQTPQDQREGAYAGAPVQIQTDPMQAEGCVYNDDIHGRYTVNPNFVRIHLSEGSGHFVRTCLKRNLGFFVDVMAIGEPDDVTHQNRGRTCATVGLVRTFRTEAGGGFFDSCNSPVSKLKLQYVGEYGPPRRGCAAGFHFVYLSQYRSGFNGTCVTDEMAIDVKVNGSDGPVSVNVGQPFTLSWSARGALDVKMVSSGLLCPRPFGLRGITGELNGQTTLTSLPIPMRCVYTAQARVGSNDALTVSDTVAVDIVSAKAPTLVFTASPPSVTAGQPFYLSWSSTNTTAITTTVGPTSCPNAGTLVPVTAGLKRLVAPATTSPLTCRYTATASGPGGTTTATATISIAQAVPSAPAITSFGANPTTITATTTYSYTVTNLLSSDRLEVRYSNCTNGLSLTTDVVPTVSSGTYPRIFTSNLFGSCQARLVAVRGGSDVATSNPVTLTIDTRVTPTLSCSSPTSVTAGQPFTITCTTTNTTSVVVALLVGANCPTGGPLSPVGTGSPPVSGSITMTSPLEPTSCVYRISATGPGGTSSRQVTIVIVPAAPATSCQLLVCINYDSRIITLPPPGFSRIMQPLISEVAP